MHLLPHMSWVLDSIGFQVQNKKLTALVTHPNSYKHIKVLAKVRMHDVLFPATGGGHITHDDFKSMDISVCNEGANGERLATFGVNDKMFCRCCRSIAEN